MRIIVVENAMTAERQGGTSAMNFDVLILFFNAFFSTALSTGIVIWILRTQYLPAIREEEERRAKAGVPSGVSRSGTPASVNPDRTEGE